MFGISTTVKILLLQTKWKIKYKNENNLIPKTLFPIELVIPGKHSYGELNVISYNNNAKLYIGNYVSIAQNVSFVLNGDHNVNNISTYPFKNKIIDNTIDEAATKGDIIVEDDAWIGYGSIILSGVEIGQGAIIAAGSVVTKNVPPYAVVGGVPAKIIKHRFNKKQITKLNTIDYSQLTDNMIKENIDYFYLPYTDDTDLSWLPKKSIRKKKSS